MSKMWIVQGDITSSGGKVITGSPFTDIDGKPVARITDKATCPSHKGVFPIVDGDPTIVIDGQPVALHGSKLACGCSVLSVAQLSVFIDQGRGLRPSSYEHAAAVPRNEPSSRATARPAPSPSTAPTASGAGSQPAPSLQPTSPACWIADHDKSVSAQSDRYSESFDVSGRKHNYASPIKFKISIPTKSSNKIIVTLKIRAIAKKGVTASDVATAKQNMDAGISAYWNGKLAIEIFDQPCGTKSMPIEYQVAWVTSGEDYTMNVHSSYPREGVTGKVIDVSVNTTPWTYAHEFGHCIGEPDEYSYTADTETVQYYRPDGTLDSIIISAPPVKPSNDATATIMSSHGNTTVLPRHGWSVAREAEELLTKKIGRPIKCSVT